jgi:acetyltransferase-like isoleucine patch superfamily enzyme
MLLTKHSNIRIIGYPDAALAQEMYYYFSKEPDTVVEIISPGEILSETSENLKNFSYIVSFTLDKNLRLKIINKIEDLNLDCIIYLHDSSILNFDVTDSAAVKKIVGHGTFIGPQSHMMLSSTIGKHCIVEASALIGHHVTIGNNVIIHPTAAFAGRSTIGNNCEFNVRSMIFPKVTICDNVLVCGLADVTKDITESGTYMGSSNGRRSARRVGDYLSSCIAN